MDVIGCNLYNVIHTSCKYREYSVSVDKRVSIFVASLPRVVAEKRDFFANLGIQIWPFF